MKFPRFATVALLTGALMVACGDDDDPVTPTVVIPPAPAPIFGTVSGTVSVEGSGLAEVSVNLTGPAAQSTTTGSSGGYSFSNVPAGAHNVGISGTPPDVAFVSTSMAVTIATNGQTATADFSGNYIRTSSITGSVTAGDGDESVGVVATVTAAGSGMLTDEEPAIGSSDTDGNFELTGLRAGGYAVTISDYPEGTEFPVTTRDVTVGVGLSATVSFNAPGEDGPTTGTNPFLPVITGVTSDSDDGTYSGRLTATVDIERERGDARFEKITLYVDGSEAASQSFGLASASGEGPVAAQQAAQQIVFSLSFDSDEYDETGAVTYSNGAHKIVGGVTVQGSTDEAFSNQFEVEFDNEDGVHVVVSGQTQLPVIGQDGAYWYGGPGAGFDLTVVPVIYSGRTVPSVTLREGFCVGNDGEAVAAAPYAFTPDCGGHEGLVEPNSFSIGAAAVQTLNAEDEVFSIQLDYAGPGAPVFMPNPNGREDGWINDAVGLAAKHDSKKNDDGWLTYGAAGGGVGGYTVQLQVGEDMEEALAATASSTPTLPAASKENAYCFVASAVDDLGNRSKLPDEDDGCADPGDYMAAVTAVEGMGDEGDDDYVAPVDAEDAVVFSSITAGVDTEAPTLEFTGASAGAGDDPDRAATLESEFELQVKDNDDGSGVHGADPVLATLSIRNADGAECRELGALDEEDKKCAATSKGLTKALPLVRTDGVSGLTDTGYYEFTALAQDKAGNQSAEMSEVALYDNEAPEVQLSTTRSTDFAKDFTLNKVLVATDDLSLRDYTVNLVATGLQLGANIPIEFAMGSNTWDEYDASDLTRDDVVRGPVELPFIAVQATVTATPSVIASLKVDIRDQVEGRTDAVSESDDTDIEVGDDDGFAATNFDRTNVKAFALSHNGGDAATDDGIDDSKSSIKLTATAVVVGKIQTVTVTTTSAEGVETVDDPTVTNVTDQDLALGTTTTTDPDPVVEGEQFTTTVTTISTLPNPFSSVNFYATDDGGTELTDASQLRLITSVSAARADVETVAEVNEPDGSAVGDRVWTYEVTMSADDYYAMVGGDEEYVGSILAIGVNENDKGVALASGAVVLNFEER